MKIKQKIIELLGGHTEETVNKLCEAYKWQLEQMRQQKFRVGDTVYYHAKDHTFKQRPYFIREIYKGVTGERIFVLASNMDKLPDTSKLKVKGEHVFDKPALICEYCGK